MPRARRSLRRVGCYTGWLFIAIAGEQKDATDDQHRGRRAAYPQHVLLRGLRGCEHRPAHIRRSRFDDLGMLDAVSAPRSRHEQAHALFGYRLVQEAIDHTASDLRGELRLVFYVARDDEHEVRKLRLQFLAEPADRTW